MIQVNRFLLATLVLVAAHAGDQTPSLARPTDSIDGKSLSDRVETTFSYAELSLETTGSDRRGG